MIRTRSMRDKSQSQLKEKEMVSLNCPKKNDNSSTRDPLPRKSRTEIFFTPRSHASHPETLFTPPSRKVTFDPFENNIPIIADIYFFLSIESVVEMFREPPCISQS